MKRIFVLASVFALFALSAAAQGEAKSKTPNFGGTWNLDIERSQLGSRSNIESQVMTVTQTVEKFKVETSTKRTAVQAITPGGFPPSGRGKPAMSGGMPGGSPGGGAGGDVPWTYGLDGKDTKGQSDGPMGPVPVTLNAKFDGARLFLTRSSTMTDPSGSEITMATSEIWEVLTDGKTLRVDAQRTSRRGTESTIRIYTRKDQK